MSEEKVKKVKKLSKVVEGSAVIITEGVTEQRMTFDSAELNDTIKNNLMLHGLSQKLGDAAAGRDGQEAVDAINKVWEGLVKGDWSIRVPAGEKITKKSLIDKYNEMPDGADKDSFKSLLDKLGVKF